MPIFWWGVLGSMAVEIVSLARTYERTRRFPAKYADWRYWLLRSSLAVMGGALAVAQEVHTPLLAIQIGAATQGQRV